MTVQVPDEVFGVKEYECTVVSNKNVATFIKEFIVALPPGEHMDFIPGSYAQINIPKYSMDYNVDIDVAIFTNLTHEHLDVHGDMQTYAYDKSLLFSTLGNYVNKFKRIFQIDC